MKIICFLLFTALIASCEEGSTKKDETNQKEVPHLLKDPYIKMLAICGE